MKYWIGFILLIFLSSSTCNKASKNKNCFKAKLEIKGICMNYTISLLEGDTAALLLAPEWTDETSGKKYTNVFALSNPCGFPDLKEGEEFYFTLEKDAKKDCMVCEAYYPTPAQKNNIRVITEPCP
jgi:hypothetical protein